MACLGKNKQYYYIKRSTIFQGAEKQWKREKTGRKGRGKEETNKERKNRKKKDRSGNKGKKKG